MPFAECEDVVFPGVGVYTPGTHNLEGDAVRLMGFKGSPESLTIHVRDSLSLKELLCSPVVQASQDVTLDYHCPFSVHTLKWALAVANFDGLKRLTVTGKNQLVVQPWELEPLPRLFKCLSGVDMTVLGTPVPRLPRTLPDELVHGEEDSWFRIRGHAVAVTTRHLPWVEAEIIEQRPIVLEIDFENGFHPHGYEILTGGQLIATQEVWAFNVRTPLVNFFDFLKQVKMPRLREFHLTGMRVSTGAVSQHLAPAKFVLH